MKKYVALGCQIDDRHSKRHVQQLTEAGKMLLHGQVRDMMSRHDPSQAAVLLDSSDDTPLFLNNAWTIMFGSRVVTRKAQTAHKYLVDMCFYSGHSTTGEILTSDFSSETLLQ